MTILVQTVAGAIAHREIPGLALRPGLQIGTPDRQVFVTKRLSGHSAHIEAILNTVGEGIITADTEQVILLANQEAERIFGYQQDELHGVTLQALMPEKYRARHHAGFSEAVSSEELRTSGKYLELKGAPEGRRGFSTGDSLYISRSGR